MSDILHLIALIILTPVYFAVTSASAVTPFPLDRTAEWFTKRPLYVFEFADRPSCNKYWAVQRLRKAKENYDTIKSQYSKRAQEKINERGKAHSNCTPLSTAGDGQVHGSIDVHQKHKEEVCKYAL